MTTRAGRVLVVDDDATVASTVERCLTRNGFSASWMSDPIAALTALAADETWDVVLLDIGLPQMDGIAVLEHIRAMPSPPTVIMLTGDDRARTATRCLRAGAYHYLTKPLDPDELVTAVTAAASFRALQAPPVETDTSPMLVGSSAVMQRLRAAIEQVGPQDVTVLLQGESGTGKELVARALHERSPRRDEPFIAVNCGAIPEGLIDSELFGHAQGAFTGAHSDRAGLFAEADGGTLFLDEIGEMPLAVQAKLLRALQEHEVRPLGGAPRRVDVRVIAATHVDLEQAVASQRFRADLFYRVGGLPLVLAPLRERREDIPELVSAFLRKHGGAAPRSLTPAALDRLMSQAWLGNVRQLENAIVYALAMHKGDVIDVDALPSSPGATGSVASHLPAPTPVPHHALPLSEAKRQAVSSFERAYVVSVLELSGGSVSEAARIAGIDRTNLRRLLKRYELETSSFRRPK